MMGMGRCYPLGHLSGPYFHGLWVGFIRKLRQGIRSPSSHQDKRVNLNLVVQGLVRRYNEDAFARLLPLCLYENFQTIDQPYNANYSW